MVDHDEDVDGIDEEDNEGCHPTDFRTEDKRDATTAALRMTVSERIAKREARFVRCLRLGLFFVLLTTSAVAVASVHIALSQKEQDDFEEAFADYSSKLTEQFESVAVRCIGAIAAFSAAITAHTVASKETWPFLTLPSFYNQVRHIKELANVKSMVFAPIVTSEEREEWETSFVPQNINTWIQDSIKAQHMYDGYFNETLLDYQVKPIQWNGSLTNGYKQSLHGIMYTPDGDLYFGSYNSSSVTPPKGPYLPLWQLAPFIPEYDNFKLNFDLSTDLTFKGNIIDIVTQRKAALGRYTTEDFQKDKQNIPTSGLYYPILKDTTVNSTVGGTLVTVMYWLRFFANILPQSAVGIVGVLENSCNQSFTFRVDGGTATFVGNNDLHDPQYDNYKQEVSFLSLFKKSYDNKEYLGLPIDDTGCTNMLSVYPSEDMQNQYKTNTPLVASIVILLVFLVTSSLFFVYDCLVQRRQRKVQKEAESSGAIVSSLFPEAYRERLMAAQPNQNRNGNKSKPNESLCSNVSSCDADALDQAIADLYPECTVLFADIAGFTHWSSTREPVQVFWLLQEVFAAMDRSAKKYHVFKVETIGDCYMAVTGLPNPQHNHALLMSRFATDCLIQMNETTTRLMGPLGKDTANLTLRIGLNSGPVIAGILRGEKSRFQLFGDTVNTASRMESTGDKSRIQLTSTTANLLRDSGKGHWLQPRDDLVEAKGKGKMQTYWLVTDRGQQSSSSKYSAVVASTRIIDPTHHNENNN